MSAIPNSLKEFQPFGIELNRNLYLQAGADGFDELSPASRVEALHHAFRGFVLEALKSLR
ncbi:MAG: hypothetical protein R2880_03615 [Deinococcales bacterium]